MAVDWSVTDMRNYDVLSTFTEKNIDTGEEVNRKWHPVTGSLIWLTIHTGINSITEENWKEFYYRTHVWESTLEPLLWRYDGKRKDEGNRITPLEVYMHIGLHTNASSLTRPQFLKKLMEIVERESVKTVSKAPEEYEELGLSTINEEEYQAAQFVKARADLADIGTMVRRYKETGTSSTNPMETDENIISVD